MSPDRIEIQQTNTVEVPRDKRGRIRWTILTENPEQLIGLVELEVQSLISNGFTISEANFNANGLSGLLSGVKRFYPGGLIGLKERFGTVTAHPQGYWSDPENIEREAQAFIETAGKISQKLLREQNRGDLSHAIFRHYPGGTRALTAKLGLSDLPSKPSGYWNPDRIRQQALEVYQQVGSLTQSSLSKAGRRDLIYGIHQYYPGGIRQLQQDFGLKSKTPDGYWTDETIELEARKFFEQEGGLTGYRLQKRGRSALGRAIDQHYPGGMKRLRESLGIQGPNRIPTSHWTKEQIEAKAREFLDQEGDFSHKLLKAKGRSDLSLAMTTHYPGGTRSLRTALNLPQRQLSPGSWTQERIAQAAREFLTSHGDLNISLLKRTRSSALSAAIYKFYPGGISALRQDLGLPPTKKPIGFWTPEQIEEVALEFYKTEGTLTSKSLRARGNPTLASLISTSYPGGMNALKAKLGIEYSRYPEGYWTTEKIEAVVSEFLGESPYLTEGIMEEAERSDLAYVVRHYYPGGLVRLRDNLGLRIPEKVPKWTPESIEAEARVFFEEFGVLTHRVIIANKRSYLSSAIVNHYPGGYPALKQKLGIISSADRYLAPDEANEQLRKLLEKEI